MKRIILSAAIVSFLSFAASAQQTATVETKTDVQSFLELKAKTEYSSKYCTAVNLIALCVMDNSRADELFTITSTWLYGAIAFSSKARSNYVFKEYAKRASYTQVSAVINEFKTAAIQCDNLSGLIVIDENLNEFLNANMGAKQF